MAISGVNLPGAFGNERQNPLFEIVCQVAITAAGFTSAAAGDIKVGMLPAGRLRIRPDLSRLQCPIGTATSDLDVGLAAFVKADGTTQALQGALLADSLDVGGAAINQNLQAVAPVEINSRDGAAVVCSFDTANSPAAGVLQLNLVFEKL